jgi:hypothetical protein
MTDRETLVIGVLRHITNVSNLPLWMQVSALGRDMKPLAEGIADALIASGAVAPTAEYREQIAQAVEARAVEVYPTDVFIQPTSEQYREINALLKRERGHMLDAISADVTRRAHAAIAQELRDDTLARKGPTNG